MALTNSGVPPAAVRAAVKEMLPGGTGFKECLSSESSSLWVNRVKAFTNTSRLAALSAAPMVEGFAVGATQGEEEKKPLVNGKPCGASFTADENTCHVGESLAVDVPDTARGAQADIKAVDKNGRERTFAIISTRNTRAGAKFAYEQNDANHIDSFRAKHGLPDIEKPFRATLFEIVDDLPRAVFHNSYDSIKEASSKGFNEMWDFAAIKDGIARIQDKSVVIKNSGWDYDALLNALAASDALLNKTCGDSFIPENATCHIGETKSDTDKTSEPKAEAAEEPKFGHDNSPESVVDKLPKASAEAFKDKSDIPDISAKERDAVVTQLDKLNSMADKAKAGGNKPEDFNLCQISVPGTNLYCDGNLGIPREEMPQFKGKAIEGTPAAKLPKDKSGEVDTEPMFKQMLSEKGIKTVAAVVPSDRLKATQSELVGDKVAGMMRALESNPEHPAITAPIYVSRDGYVIDGHHRWAAMTSLAIKTGKPTNMKVVVIDDTAKNIIPMANKFAQDIGIAAKRGKVDEAKKVGNRAGVDEPPTQAQKEAGNYSKRKLSFQGLPISIENEKDSERSGVGPDGKPWSVTMPAPYGYVRRTEGMDGDHVDVYVGPSEDSDKVFVIDQVDADTGEPDEHKCMVGFNTEDEARNTYQKAFSDGRGPDRIGKITPMTMDGFKEWLKDFKVSNRAPAPWYGVDLDGTLAVQDGKAFKPGVIGAVVEPVRDLVIRLLDAGHTVKIFTARAADPENIPHIKRWLDAAGLPSLEVTNIKDPGMVALYDDRAVAVAHNTGEILGGEPALLNAFFGHSGRPGERGGSAPREAGHVRGLPGGGAAKPWERRVPDVKKGKWVYGPGGKKFVPDKAAAAEVAQRAVQANRPAQIAAPVRPPRPAVPESDTHHSEVAPHDFLPPRMLPPMRVVEPARPVATPAAAVPLVHSVSEGEPEHFTKASAKMHGEISSSSEVKLESLGGGRRAVVGHNHVSEADKLFYKTVENGKEVTKVSVFKPIDGERKGLYGSRLDDRRVPAANRELAAFETAAKLGITTPTAAMVSVNGKTGSSMEFKEPHPQSGGRNPPESIWDSKAAPVRVAELGLFDYVIGNMDRHSNNLIVDRDGKIHPIDHGLSFPEKSGAAGSIESYNRSAFLRHASLPVNVTPEAKQRMGQIVDELKKPEFDRWIDGMVARRGLDKESGNRMRERVKHIVDTWALVSNSRNASGKMADALLQKGWA